MRSITIILAQENTTDKGALLINGSTNNHEKADKQDYREDNLDVLDRILAPDNIFNFFGFDLEHIEPFDNQTNVDAALPRAEFGVVGALHDSHEVLIGKIVILALVQSFLPVGFVARNLDSVCHPVTTGLDDVGVDEGGHG